VVVSDMSGSLVGSLDPVGPRIEATFRNRDCPGPVAVHRRETMGR
jgi:hypothetical protein